MFFLRFMHLCKECTNTLQWKLGSCSCESHCTCNDNWLLLVKVRSKNHFYYVVQCGIRNLRCSISYIENNLDLCWNGACIKVSVFIRIVLFIYIFHRWEMKEIYSTENDSKGVFSLRASPDAIENKITKLKSQYHNANSHVES